TGEDLIVRTGVEAAQGGCHTATESAPGCSGAASGSHCAPIRVYRHRAAVDRHRRPADGARGARWSFEALFGGLHRQSVRTGTIPIGPDLDVVDATGGSGELETRFQVVAAIVIAVVN